MNIPLRPPGVKLFGAFLAPYPAGNYELQYHTDWSFENGFKPQIDAIKSIGGNFVAYLGGAGIVARGSLPLATYIARRRQVAEYIASKGMYALTYGSGSFSLDDAAFTNAQYCTAMAADAALHSEFPNQVGYATVDEPWARSVDFGGPLANATIVSYLAAQYTAAKAAVPADFSITVAPNPSTQSGSAAFDYTGAAQVRCDSVAPYCDFFAFHPFYTVTLAESAAVRAAYPGKQIIMPSTMDMQDGDTRIPSAAASICGLVGFNGFRGMAWFVLRDFQGLTEGMFSTNGATPEVLTPRVIKTNAFQAGNTAIDLTNRRVYRGKPRLTNFRKWGN